MPTTLARKNTKAVPALSAEALARVAAHNIALPTDEQVNAGNFSVRVLNDEVHSDVWVMQMLRNIFKTDAKKSADVTLALHNNGSAILFTGSRDNCRMLMRQVALHGGCMAANLMLGIENDKSLATEMVRNKDGAIVQRSGNDDDGGNEGGIVLAE